jgi:hypothetical protein
MNRKNIFYILGLIGILSISFSSVLLLTKNVVGFDVIGVSSRDCVPYNVFIERAEKDHTVNIKWSTKAECIGFVQYGRDRSNLDMVAVDLTNKSKSKEHIVSIGQLLSSEIYYFLINSQEQAYGNNGVPLEFILGNL